MPEIIVASFIDDGNDPSANDLLNSSRRIGVKISILSSITLVGISESWVGSLTQNRFFSSFSISFPETFSKQKVLFVLL